MSGGIEAEDYREVGDTFIVHVHRTGVGRSGGVRLEDTAHHVWTFRGKRLIRVEIFKHEAEALEAVGLSELGG